MKDYQPKLSDVLAEAANLLEFVGWCQHVSAQDRGAQVAIEFLQAQAYCAAGALYLAKLALGYYYFGISMHPYIIIELQKIGVDSLVTFNDSRGQTSENVIALLRRAAKAADRDGQ